MNEVERFLTVNHGSVRAPIFSVMLIQCVLGKYSEVVNSQSYRVLFQQNSTLVVYIDRKINRILILKCTNEALLEIGGTVHDQWRCQKHQPLELRVYRLVYIVANFTSTRAIPSVAADGECPVKRASNEYLRDHCRYGKNDVDGKYFRSRATGECSHIVLAVKYSGILKKNIAQGVRQSCQQLGSWISHRCLCAAVFIATMIAGLKESTRLVTILSLCSTRRLSNRSV